MFENNTETDLKPKLSKFWVDSSGKLINISFDKKEIEVVKPFELKDKYLALSLGLAFLMANIIVFFSVQYLNPELIHYGFGEKVLVYIATLVVVFTFLLLFFTMCYLLSFLAIAFSWQSKVRK